MVIDPAHPGTRIEVDPDGQMRFYDSVQMMGVTLSEVLMGGPAPEEKTAEMVCIKLGDGTQKPNNVYYANHGYQNRHGYAAKWMCQVVNASGVTLTEGRSGDKLLKIQEVDGNQLAITFSSKLGVNEVEARIWLEKAAP